MFTDNLIRGHKEIKEDVVDKETKSVYTSQKFIYNFVKHRIPDMKQPMRKHFEDIGDFIDGYEAGVIRHWWDFYKTAADWVKEWDNLSVKEFREKVNKLEGKKVY